MFMSRSVSSSAQAKCKCDFLFCSDFFKVRISIIIHDLKKNAREKNKTKELEKFQSS